MAWNNDTKKLVVKFLEAVENTMIYRPTRALAPKDWVTAFDELKKYVEDDYIHWAYKVGLKLDEHISWSGVDNRKRIEQVIDEWLELKRVV